MQNIQVHFSVAGHGGGKSRETERERENKCEVLAFEFTHWPLFVIGLHLVNEKVLVYKYSYIHILIWLQPCHGIHLTSFNIRNSLFYLWFANSRECETKCILEWWISCFNRRQQSNAHKHHMIMMVMIAMHVPCTQFVLLLFRNARSLTLSLWVEFNHGYIPKWSLHCSRVLSSNSWIE